MKPFHEIIRRPLVTEKTVAARLEHRYSFEVAKEASKPAIRQAVEGFFKVKVVSVHTMTVPGKKRRQGRHEGYQSSWKKAIVTLATGQKIEMLEAE